MIFQNKKIEAHFLLLLITIISGANYSLLKQIVPSKIEPSSLILIRLFVAGLGFWIIEKIFLPTTIQPKGKDLFIILLCAMFGAVFNQVFFYEGMKITTPINGSIFNLFNPITIIIGSFLVLKQKMNWIVITGIVFSILGAILLLDIKNFHVDNSTSKGDLFVMTNAISYGFYVILVSFIASKYNAITITKYMFGIGFVLYFPFGIAQFNKTDFALFQRNDWLILAYILLLVTLFSYAIGNYLPRITSAYLMGMYVYLQPFVAAIIALIIGNGSLNRMQICCGILILLGIYLAQKGKNKANLNE